MSKYRKMRTQYTSRTMLREALKAAGVAFEEARPGQSLNLYGYEGDRRADTATFVVRRAHISRSSNDLGFRWDAASGCFEEVVSEYDSTERNTTRIRQAVKREYAVATTVSAARIKGWAVERIDQPGGAVQLRVTGRI